MHANFIASFFLSISLHSKPPIAPAEWDGINPIKARSAVLTKIYIIYIFIKAESI